MIRLLETVDFCKKAGVRDVVWTQEFVINRRKQMSALQQYILALVESKTGKQIDIEVKTTSFVLNAVVTVKVTAPGHIVERCVRYFAALGY